MRVKGKSTSWTLRVLNKHRAFSSVPSSPYTCSCSQSRSTRKVHWEMEYWIKWKFPRYLFNEWVEIYSASLPPVICRVGSASQAVLFKVNHVILIWLLSLLTFFLSNFENREHLLYVCAGENTHGHCYKIVAVLNVVGILHSFTLHWVLV